MQPILAWDFIIPEQEICDWDMKLLQDSKWAIFWVTNNPAGELMELESARREPRHKDRILVVSPQRPGKVGQPEITTMVKTAGTSIIGPIPYKNHKHLRQIILDFLEPHRISLNDFKKTYLDRAGIKYTRISHIVKIKPNGECNITYIHEGMQCLYDTVCYECAHGLGNEGEMTYFDFVFDKKDVSRTIEWYGDKLLPKEGFIWIKNGLRKRDDPVKRYTLKCTYYGAFSFTKEEFDRRHPEDPFPYEWHIAESKKPTDELHVKIEFPKGYNVKPQWRYLGKCDENPCKVLDTGECETFDLKNGLTLKHTTENHIKDSFAYQIFWEPPKQKIF